MDEFDFATDYYIKSPQSGFRDKLNIGVEKRLLWDMLRLRSGLSMGQWVYGVGLYLKLWKLPILDINYASYIDEFNRNVDNERMRYHAIQFGVLF